MVIRFPRWLKFGWSDARTSAISYSDDQRSLRRWLACLYLVPAAGIIGMLIYALEVKASGRVFGVSLLLAAAAWITAGLLGFLFAIPQSASGATARDTSSSGAYRSNSNLEQISDWLTKILVGVSLVELSRLAHLLHRVIDFVSPSLGTGASNAGYVLALLLLFAASGFLSVYILTRTYIGVLFAQTEETLQQIVAQKATELNIAATTVDAETKGAAPDAEPGAETLLSIARSVAGVDPSAAAAGARARVIETLQSYYSLLYGTTTNDLDEIAARLQADGYIDSQLMNLSRQILDLTRSATNIENFTPGASASVVDASEKFLRSVGRSASLNFEAKVEEKLHQIDGVHVVRRPPPRAGRQQPDFLVMTGRSQIIVESYLPPRPQEGALVRRIDDRLRLLDSYDASGLVVVLPDGFPSDLMSVSGHANVTVATITQLPTAIQE
jgi:hypothetical protein